MDTLTEIYLMLPKEAWLFILGLLAAGIFFWLRKDMNRQREWREEKERKIAETKARIARKNAQKDAD